DSALSVFAALSFVFMKLSVIVPAYNEEKTIVKVLERLQAVELIQDVRKEIIVVNDASKDNTEALVLEFARDYPELDLRYFRQEFNQGKGAALHSGIREATGDFLIIQDADLEYDPSEFNILLEPILKGHADVVYGSRFMGGKPHRKIGRAACRE